MKEQEKQITMREVWKIVWQGKFLLEKDLEEIDRRRQNGKEK